MRKSSLGRIVLALILFVIFTILVASIYLISSNIDAIKAAILGIPLLVVQTYLISSTVMFLACLIGFRRFTKNHSLQYETEDDIAETEENDDFDKFNIQINQETVKEG